ncbi:galactose mutarotase-like [Hylaeus anthracinus]|uniref:galactose mutarotase-like n=1 Tax=Hylaeus volcanicus TaxID=313075 RepID=UPI0023B7EEB4|nr:galactose mutarotase-like [Hylaeus volcanicus]XP_053998811.1 galactose mutarotase-like [Hylaeus anthracinus]
MDFHGCNCKNITITEGIFGEIWVDSDGDQIFTDSVPKIVKSYTMANTNHMEITVITWGATIMSLKCPDKYGHTADVVLGFDDLKGYMNPITNPFIGCILGRCANRIKNGHIAIRGKDYELTKNDFNGKHHLHGGVNGFGRKVWDSYIAGCSVVMSYLSQDGEEGYPGAVLTTIRFKLTADNKLEICMRATTSKPTIVNLSHGSMFNLAGHDAGEKELKKHKILLNCDRWTFADYTDPVPTGAIRGVGGTVMDFRIPRILGEYMGKVPPGEGYDHNLCITKNGQSGSIFVAKAWHVKSGRVLEVYSDQRGVQFYTGGRLPPQIVPEFSTSYDILGEEDNTADENDESYNSDAEDGEEMKIEKPWKKIITKPKKLEFLLGKHGAHYKKYCAFSIQPQNYPSAIHYSHFPCSILYPGQVYCHDLTYKFEVQLANFM